MARPCSICNRADIEAINARLHRGESPAAVAKAFGLIPRTVSRHKASHLADGLREARSAAAERAEQARAAEEIAAGRVGGIEEYVLGTLYAIAEDGKAGGKPNLVLSAMRAVISLLGVQKGADPQGVSINIISREMFEAFTGDVVRTLDAHPAARADLLRLTDSRRRRANA